MDALLVFTLGIILFGHSIGHFILCLILLAAVISLLEKVY